MVALLVELVRQDGSPVARARLPLDAEQIGEPVARAGLDWLRLQGDPSVEAAGRDWLCRLEWEPQGLTGSLRVDLVHLGSLRWQGRVPPAELLRIAMRGARALAAAGAWPAVDHGAGHRVHYRLVCGEDERVVSRPSFSGAAGATGGLGIECAPSTGTARASIPVLEAADLAAAEVLHEEPAPDLVLVLRPRVMAAIDALLDESWRVQEERALVLFGRRCRLAQGRSPWLPLFDVESVERPRAESATATEIVLEHGPLMARALPGHGAIGLLHTHLPPVSLEASDPDRRDLEDLNSGGPDAVSVIFHAGPRDQARPGCAVFARLGARGGLLCRARARLLASSLDRGER